MFNTKDRILELERRVDTLASVQASIIEGRKVLGQQIEDLQEVVNNNAEVQRVHERKLEGVRIALRMLASIARAHREGISKLTRMIGEQDEAIADLEVQAEDLGTAADLLAKHLKLELVMKPEEPPIFIPPQPAELVLVKPQEAKKLREAAEQQENERPDAETGLFLAE